MRTMKKDMGGAALVLALAHVVMAARLPVALRVLVPCVENAVGGDAYRPLDVLATRAGIAVEQVWGEGSGGVGGGGGGVLF
jgi:leucyl aminopeptidase